MPLISVEDAYCCTCGLSQLAAAFIAAAEFLTGSNTAHPQVFHLGLNFYTDVQLSTAQVQRVYLRDLMKHLDLWERLCFWHASLEMMLKRFRQKHRSKLTSPTGAAEMGDSEMLRINTQNMISILQSNMADLGVDEKKVHGFAFHN
jgi:hypothetical protein